jgi:ArsR family transcriptional regulator, zinc-responsive transcriptional repressor
LQREGERLAKIEKNVKLPWDEGLSTIAFLAKCLSDENRIKILLFLSNGKESVSRIVEELKLSQPLVSHHLKELKRSLLVTVERNGPFIYYDMADKRIIAVLKDLQVLANYLLANRKTF